MREPASKKTGDEAVGRRIARRRDDLAMSRDDLAKAVGVSYPFIAQIETGYRMPAYDKQLKIARALGLSLDQVFGAEGPDADLTAPRAGAVLRDDEPDAVSFAIASEAFPTGVLAAGPRAARAPSPRAASAVGASASASAPPTAPASGSASARQSSPGNGSRAGSQPAPTFDEAVARAIDALSSLPAARRLDALSRVQLSVTRSVADEARQRVGTGAQPSGWIERLAPDEVFVFGSNAAGYHGGGAARIAYERFGAVWGEGHGHHGQSYAIDTMSGLDTIKAEVAEFLAYARRHSELRFLVTPIGTGIAGFRVDEIAPLFDGAPANVVLPAEF